MNGLKKRRIIFSKRRCLYGYQVEPNTEEVDFGDLYGIRLNFDCNKKSFPSVKRLRFGESNELYIKFSNIVPKRKEIVSTNLKYPSEQC